MTDKKRKKSFMDDVDDAQSELQNDIADLNEAIHGSPSIEEDSDDEEYEDDDDEDEKE